MSAACCGAAATSLPAAAQTGAGAPPVLVEMFLSQSCKSSPPAAEVAAELGAREDVVALVWHVDYWNILSAGPGGRWKDPYSKPDFAERQRAYNRRIRGKGTVFTPQAVVNGASSVVGSKREAVEKNIDAAHMNAAPARLDVTEAADALSVSVSGAAGDVFLVEFHPEAITAIEGGDNAGVMFTEANVVSSITRLGAASGSATFSAAAPASDMGCAVILQEPGPGRVLAAQYCP